MCTCTYTITRTHTHTHTQTQIDRERERETEREREIHTIHTHEQARICGVPAGLKLPMKMLEFGDMRQLPLSLGAPLVDMGAVVTDNLASGVRALSSLCVCIPLLTTD